MQHSPWQIFQWGPVQSFQHDLLKWPETRKKFNQTVFCVITLLEVWKTPRNKGVLQNSTNVVSQQTVWLTLFFCFWSFQWVIFSSRSTVVFRLHCLAHLTFWILLYLVWHYSYKGLNTKNKVLRFDGWRKTKNSIRENEFSSGIWKWLWLNSEILYWKNY